MPDTITQLSARTYHCLLTCGFTPASTRYDVALRFPELWRGAYEYHDAFGEAWRWKNFGRKSLLEILRWLAEKPGERCRGKHTES